MSVTKRGQSWQAYITVNGERIRKNFDSKVDAEAWEHLVRHSMKLGKPIPELNKFDNSYTLEEATDRTYKMHWAGGKSEAKQILIMKELINYFGKHMPVSDITTSVIDDFIMEQKSKGRANGTINRKLAALSKILRFAHEHGKLENMPVFHRQKEGKNRIRWINQDEELMIMKTLEQWGQIDILEAFIVSVDTGIRYSELLNIRTKDIIKDGLYIGESKNEQPRLVPLTKRSREVLLMRSKNLEPNQRVFDFKYNWHRSIWERAKNHLGLDDVVWHTLRHTTCSRLVQGGLPLPHVKDWMGHKTIITTMRYAHLAPIHLTEGLTILEGN